MKKIMMFIITLTAMLTMATFVYADEPHDCANHEEHVMPDQYIIVDEGNLSESEIEKLIDEIKNNRPIIRQRGNCCTNYNGEETITVVTNYPVSYKVTIRCKYCKTVFSSYVKNF